MQNIFKELSFGSEDYHHSIVLRDLVLRKPLGMQFTQEQLAAENDQTHYGLFINDRIIACLVVKNLECNVVKVRQVAVHPDFQNSGYGTILSQEVEKIFLKQGKEKIELHARETAVNFYKKLGYNIEGEPFKEIGIPHFKMVKQIYDSTV